MFRKIFAKFCNVWQSVSRCGRSIYFCRMLLLLQYQSLHCPLSCSFMIKCSHQRTKMVKMIISTMDLLNHPIGSPMVDNFEIIIASCNSLRRYMYLHTKVCYGYPTGGPGVAFTIMPDEKMLLWNTDFFCYGQNLL